jgi:NADPH-dependent 2,4-dienoyl-CoA reductase/sulfur reductase-like enzyme
MSKIVLIGANHAGTAAANTILDNYPENELVIFDSSDNISYLGCGTALWIGRQIDDPASLFYASAGTFEGKRAVVHMETRVEKIDFAAKTVCAADKCGRRFLESYDKLIIAAGSKPIAPNIPGMDLEGVEFCKFYHDGEKIDRELSLERVRRVAVVGAGYIGVEIAEAVKRRGKEVMLFDVARTSLSNYYDESFSRDMDKVLADNGVQLHFGESVAEIRGGARSASACRMLRCSPSDFESGASASPAAKGGRVSAVVTNMGEYPADLVIMAIGFVPNNDLGRGVLETTVKGAYKVDLHQRTSLPDVYAVGDCACVYSNAIRGDAYIALATNAVRSGIVAGHNAAGTPLESNGVQGSNGICIFGWKMVSTGLSAAAAKKSGFDPVCTDFEDLQKPGFIKAENGKVKIRIVYDRASRKVLGAQMASACDISMGIHMFSLAIQEGVTIDRLKLLDIFFLPHFNQPYNYITMAAITAK